MSIVCEYLYNVNMKIGYLRRSNSSTRETNQSKIAPDEDGTRLFDNQRNVSIESESAKGDNLVSAEANRMKGGKNKKSRFCCLSFGS